MQLGVTQSYNEIQSDYKGCYNRHQTVLKVQIEIIKSFCQTNLSRIYKPQFALKPSNIKQKSKGRFKSSCWKAISTVRGLRENERITNVYAIWHHLQ